MLPSTKSFVYTEESLSNLMISATRVNAAFGLALKVRGNDVLNWTYADVDALRLIAAGRGDVQFMQADNIRFGKTLRELVLSLTEKTPFVALMIRYEKSQPKSKSWEFVDIAFLKNLTLTKNKE
jgi:hypothetical protein